MTRPTLSETERIAVENCARFHGIPDDAPVQRFAQLLREHDAAVASGCTDPLPAHDLGETENDIVWILLGRPSDLHCAPLGPRSGPEERALASHPLILRAEERVETFATALRSLLC